MSGLIKKWFYAYGIPLSFVILWSVGSIFNKFGIAYTTPFAFLFYRLILAGTFLLVLAFITKSPWPKNWASWRRIIGTGLVLQFGYLSLFYYTLYNQVSPAIVTIILGLQPIFTVVLLEFILKNKISKNQWIGSILGLVGVFLVVFKDLTYGTMTSTGLFFAVASLFAMTIGSLMQKRTKDMNLITGTAIQLIISIIPAAVFNAYLGSFVLPLEPLFLVSLVWVALVVSVGAICIYYALLKNTEIVRTTNLFYLVPPLTALLCYFVFGEELHAYLVLSIVLIITGMLIAEKKSVLD